MTMLNKKYIRKLDFYQLSVYINEYKENLSQLTNSELLEAKKILNRLMRYSDRLKKRDKIETLDQMKNRKLDKHIKRG